MPTPSRAPGTAQSGSPRAHRRRAPARCGPRRAGCARWRARSGSRARRRRVPRRLSGWLPRSLALRRWPVDSPLSLPHRQVVDRRTGRGGAQRPVARLNHIVGAFRARGARAWRSAGPPGTAGIRVLGCYRAGMRARPRLLADTTPLRESRHYRLLFLGEGLAFLGSQLTVVAVPLQVYLLTRSSFAVGLVGLAQLGPLLVCSLVGGAVVDAVDRRVLLVWVQLARGALSAGLMVNALARRPALWPGPRGSRRCRRWCAGSWCRPPPPCTRSSPRSARSPGRRPPA